MRLTYTSTAPYQRKILEDHPKASHFIFLIIKRRPVGAVKTDLKIKQPILRIHEWLSWVKIKA